MEGDPKGCSEYTKGSVEQNDSIEKVSLAKDIVKNHNDHDLKAGEDHVIKEKESVNIDVKKCSVCKEETELGQNNNVQRVGSLHTTGKEENKSAENKAEEDKDLSMDFEDMNISVRRPLTREREHVREMHKTVHNEDYEDYVDFKVKIGNTDVPGTARPTNSSIFVSVRGMKMVNTVLNLLIALKLKPALPFEGIQVHGSRSIIICNPQVLDLIQSLIRIVHRMQADQGIQGSFTEQLQRGFCFLNEFSLLAIDVFNSDNSCKVAKDANYQVVILFFTLCELHMLEIQVKVSGKLPSMCVVTTCHVSPDTSSIISISRGMDLPVVSQNDMGQITTGLFIKSSGRASCHSENCKAVLPIEYKKQVIPELLERNFSHPHPDKKSHGKHCACRRDNCGDNKVQPSSPILRVLTTDSLLIPNHMISSHHEVPVHQEILQPTGYPFKAPMIFCETGMFLTGSIQPLYSSSRKRHNLWMCVPFELQHPWDLSTCHMSHKLPNMHVERRIVPILYSSHDQSSRGTANAMKQDITCALMSSERQSEDDSFQADDECCNIYDVHGGKEWTSYNKSFWPSDGKSQVNSEKWYLNLSQNHPCFRNRLTVLAIPFHTEALPPRSYIAQNDYRYHYECVRLASFSRYQGSGFRTRFAQAGFVYDFSRSMVVCPWDGSDVSSEIRRNQHTMNCAFVRQFHQINIPLHEAPSPPLPAAFAFDMAATMTSSPATEEQADRIQSQTESTVVASSEEPNQNAGSGLGQSSEGGNAADFGHIGLTDQEEGYSSFNNTASLLLSNAALEGMISRENGIIDTNYTVHHAENSNADAISGADEGASGGDTQIELENARRENRMLRYAGLCVLFKREPKCAVYLPCGHRLFCSECAVSFRKCPACKKLIQNIVSASFH